MAQRQGAELVVERARAQADGIADSARREGFEAGYAEGKATAEREAHDLLQFAENAVREAVEARSRLIAESEEALVRLAVDVAERDRQGRRSSCNPERVARTCSRARCARPSCATG